jgi:hypothetical protein
MANTPSFDEIVGEIRSILTRANIVVEEVPAPQKLAPFAFAMTADVVNPLDEELDDIATARFVLLHDPAGQEGWMGSFRCVTFVRSAIEIDMANDPLLANIGWSWFLEALGQLDCNYLAPSGTITRVASASFGSLDEREDSCELEIRASWTPLEGEKIADHARAWLRLLEQCAGLEPIPEGVAELHRSPISK